MKGRWKTDRTESLICLPSGSHLWLFLKSFPQFGDGGPAVGLIEDGAGDDEPVDAGALGLHDRLRVDAAVDLQALVGAESFFDRSEERRVGKECRCLWRRLH